MKDGDEPTPQPPSNKAAPPTQETRTTPPNPNTTTTVAGNQSRVFQDDLHTVLRSAPAPDFLEFMASVMASGILGNVAYDLVKTTFRKIKPRSTRPTPTVPTQANPLLARMAVLTRCAQVGINTPPLEQLQVRHWEETPRRGDHRYLIIGPDLEAVVMIPHGDLEGRELEVTIHAAVQDTTIKDNRK